MPKPPSKSDQLRLMREARYEKPQSIIVTPPPIIVTPAQNIVTPAQNIVTPAGIIVTPDEPVIGKRGRPRQYASNAERQRAYRQRMKP